MGDPTKATGLTQLRELLTNLRTRIGRIEKQLPGKTPVFTSVTTTGKGTFAAGITSPGVYNNSITSASPRATYADATTGALGYVSSSIRFKTDVENVGYDPGQLGKIRVVHYKYIAAVAEAERRAALPTDDPDYDPAYPVETNVGVIAEEMLALGLSDFVFFEADGVTPAGVSYDRLALAVIPYAQSLENRLAALEQAAGITPKEI